MRKCLIGLFVFLLVLSFAACGAKEKAAEKTAEKILESTGVNADLDGDKMVIKGEDGQALTIGGEKWPSSDLAKSIPAFKGGKIVSVMETNDTLLVMLEKASDEDFTAYLEEIKEIFKEEAYEMNTDTGMMYGATNDEGVGVTLIYEKDAGLSITVTQTKPEENANE